MFEILAIFEQPGFRTWMFLHAYGVMVDLVLPTNLVARMKPAITAKAAARHAFSALAARMIRI